MSNINIEISAETKDQIHDRFYDEFNIEPTEDEIMDIFHQLPLRIKNLAEEWGWFDTEVREDIGKWIRYNYVTKGNPKNKAVIEYDIPINSKEDCERINQSLGTNFISTEEHIEELLLKIYDAISEVGNNGGWYLGDGIKVKIELEYDPEIK